MANAWGELSWSQGSWGEQNNVSVSLTGLQVNCAQNSVSIAIGQQVDVTGQQLNSNINSVQAFGLAIVSVNGQGLTTNLGSLDPAPDAQVTGEQLNISSPGIVTVIGEINSGWGRLGWGEFDWGTFTLSVQVDVTGIGLVVNLGTVDAKPVTIASPAGIGLIVEEGIVDPSPDATVVGIGLSASIAVGSVVEADANVSITGIALEIDQGQAELDAVTFAVLTGQELEIALNSVTAGASAEVSPTGNQLTISVGSINVQSWQIVNTGSDVNWNIIDTAA
jgi:hypothetical protein